MRRSCRLKAAGALNNAARKLALTFSTAEVACVSKDDIIAAITEGLSRPEQAALASNFTTRTTEPTKEEQAKRDRRTSAQKTVAYYFSRLFSIAFGVEWGLRGNRGKKRTRGRGSKKRCPSNSGWVVCVLQLKDGCYYIGKTRNKRGRRAGHFFSESAGAEWT